MKTEKYKVKPCVPYQRCPICDGSGYLPRYGSTGAARPCDVCYGAKIIPMHVMQEETKKVDMEELVTCAKACKLLGISRTTLWRMESDGKIAHVMVDNHKKYRIGDLRNMVLNAV